MVEDAFYTKSLRGLEEPRAHQHTLNSNFSSRNTNITQLT